MQNNNLQVKNENTSIMASKEMAIVMPLVEDYQKVFGDIKDIEKAKKLLLTTPLSVAEVSEQSGYADYRVFTKSFKNGL